MLNGSFVVFAREGLAACVLTPHTREGTVAGPQAYASAGEVLVFPDR